MNIKQVNKQELEVEVSETKEDKTFKKYIKIDSEEGQKLIKEHNIEIDLDIEEL